MGAQLTPRRGRSGGSGKQAKAEKKYKGQPHEPFKTLDPALSLPNKASPLNYSNGAIYRGLDQQKTSKQALLGNTKSALVSRGVGTIEIKALMLILSSIAWWMAATPICIDHAGTVLLQSHKTAEQG